MQTLILKPHTHLNTDHIGLYFAGNALNNTIKKLPGIVWSHLIFVNPASEPVEVSIKASISLTGLSVFKRFSEPYS